MKRDAQSNKRRRSSSTATYCQKYGCRHHFVSFAINVAEPAWACRQALDVLDRRIDIAAVSNLCVQHFDQGTISSAERLLDPVRVPIMRFLQALRESSIIEFGFGFGNRGFRWSARSAALLLRRALTTAHQLAKEKHDNVLLLLYLQRCDTPTRLRVPPRSSALSD